MSTAFSVKTESFEGPLDLLLNLIEERKMLVSDVSLSHVADAFLSYVADKETFPVGEAAQFVVVASTLLLIKSRALLPVLTLSDEEELDVHDLEKRLKLLQIMRDAAKRFAVSIGRIFIGTGIRVDDPLFTPPSDMTPDSLHQAAIAALQNVPKKKIVDEVEVKKVVSLDEMIERLTARVQTAITMSFKDFAGGATDPREIVVGFLAMLELVKRGFAHVSQDAHFEDITIEYAGSAGTPRY